MKKGQGAGGAPHEVKSTQKLKKDLSLSGIMGVPAFYRWISMKYPEIVKYAVEDKPRRIDGIDIPVNLRDENPNGMEYDNFYVDMNGIIHPCSHPEDRKPPETEEEMFLNVMKYLDRLVGIVRPRKLLYLAIDGVAPRAKMNQQRSRRFKAAQDAEDYEEVLKEVREEMAAMGSALPPLPKKAFDSNVITPGTEFMDRLSMYIRFYIADRMNRNPYWKSIKVVFSDSNDPGEGEHKIMAFIRKQRSEPHYDPNTSHVLHGLDADLIMLALATHELRFTILREEVTFGRKDHDAKKKRLENLQQARAALRSDGGMAVDEEDDENMNDEDLGEDAWVYRKPMQRLEIWTLRTYLENEFSILKSCQTLQFDFERIVDDFVFLCFFVGNDFLPHLPSLDIRDGAIDFLFNVYKRCIPNIGGYLTSPGGIVNLSNVDIILAEVGQIEDEVFRRRKAAEEREKEIRQRKAEARKAGGYDRIGADAMRQYAVPVNQQSSKLTHLKDTRPKEGKQFDDDSNKAAAEAIRRSLLGEKRKVETEATTSGPPNGAPASKVLVMEGEHTAQGGTEAVESKRVAVKVENEPKPEVTSGEAHDSNIVPTESTPSNDAAADDSKPEEEVLPTNEEVVKTESGSDSVVPESDTKHEENVEGAGETTEIGDTAASTDKSGSVAVVEGFEGDEEVEEEDEEEEEEDISEDIKRVLEKQLAELQEEQKSRIKEKTDNLLDKYKAEVQDDIRLHEEGWKDRYYADKYKQKDIAEGGGRDRVYRLYVEGLCWIMKYYYSGCVSWNWYYPFHYAPFASDLKNVDRFEVKFELGEPFRPIEQLMAVLPGQSAHALPSPVRWLMTDDKSPIIDFYPKRAPVDPNGKAMPWLWVILLPFIDEDRLKTELRKHEHLFTDYEARRNTTRTAYVFCHRNHPNFDEFNSAIEKQEAIDLRCPNFRGHVKIADDTVPALDATVEAPMKPEKCFESIEKNDILCLEYYLPDDDAPHRSEVLPGAVPPDGSMGIEVLMPRGAPRISRMGADIANLGAQPFQRMIMNNLGLPMPPRGPPNMTGQASWGSLEPRNVQKRYHQNRDSYYYNRRDEDQRPTRRYADQRSLPSSRGRGGPHASHPHRQSSPNYRDRQSTMRPRPDRSSRERYPQDRHPHDRPPYHRPSYDRHPSERSYRDRGPRAPAPSLPPPRRYDRDDRQPSRRGDWDGDRGPRSYQGMAAPHNSGKKKPSLANPPMFSMPSLSSQMVAPPAPDLTDLRSQLASALSKRDNIRSNRTGAIDAPDNFQGPQQTFMRAQNARKQTDARMGGYRDHPRPFHPRGRGSSPRARAPNNNSSRNAPPRSRSHERTGDRAPMLNPKFNYDHQQGGYR